MLPGLESVAAGLFYLAASVQCSAQAPPPIKVIPARSAIQYDHTKSRADLDRIEIDTINPYAGRRDTHVGGLMSGEIRVEHQIAFVQERYDQIDQACLHFDRLDVTITINPTIYIAREEKPGSCEYNAILEHEKKHVEADRIVVNKYAKRIGDALSFAVKKYGASFGPFDVMQVEPVQTKLQDYIGGIVKTEVEKMNAERLAIQQGIDTYDEYERVQRLCP